MAKNPRSNMAIELLRETGDVWCALDIAAAPIRLLYRVCVDKYETTNDPEDMAILHVLERALEDLEGIGQEAKELEIKHSRSNAERLEIIVRGLKPDIQPKELAHTLFAFLTGRDTMEPNNDCPQNCPVCEGVN